jgi:hypothetical protein
VSEDIPLQPLRLCGRWLALAVAVNLCCLTPAFTDGDLVLLDVMFVALYTVWLAAPVADYILRHRDD